MDAYDRLYDALYDDQKRAIEMLRESLAAPEKGGKGRRRPLVEAPTGAGKTTLAAAVVAGARRKGKRVLFTVPAVELVEQTVARFMKHGVVSEGYLGAPKDVGVIQRKHRFEDWEAPIQVASVQTLMRRAMPEFDVAVIDEAHVVFQCYKKWFAETDKPIIGLSATPWTKGLGTLYDDLIFSVSMRELQEQGRLCKFKVYAPSVPDLSGVKVVRGDFESSQLSAVMQGKAIVGNIVEKWCQLASGLPTIAFCVDREHARTLQREFSELGIRSAYMDAETPTHNITRRRELHEQGIDPLDDLPDRDAIRDAFSQGRVQVVCNVGVLVAGVDWDVRCIVMARPTKSSMLWVQMVGRGARVAEGKPHCLVLDHTGNTLKLGYPQDIRLGRLDDGKHVNGKRLEPVAPRLPKACEECGALFRCEHRLRESRAVVCNGVELDELAPAYAPTELPVIRQSKQVVTPELKRRWWAELLGYCREYGKKPGFAFHLFRDRFDATPRGYPDWATPPSPEIKQWIRARGIRWRKGQEAQQARMMRADDGAETAETYQSGEGSDRAIARAGLAPRDGAGELSGPGGGAAL